MQLTNLSQVIIAETRQRKEFDPQALMELTESIGDRGLLHAPVMREFSTPEGTRLALVAGERRIRAIKDLWALAGELKYNGILIPEGSIPYVTLGQLSPLEAEEAELDENLHRRDLSWQEHAEAIERLHSLRGKQAELRGETHTVADTALEVEGRKDGWYQDKTRKELLVAKHLDDSDVGKAKTVDEAFKILKRKEEMRKHSELAASVGASFSADLHKCLNVDCITWMTECPEEEFDVILTDPPYGMGADKFGDGAGRMTGIEHHYNDSPEHWRQLMTVWAELAYRVAKQEAHAYVCCDFDKFHELKMLMQKAGWYVFRTPLINVKLSSGRVPIPERGPRRQYEIILYAIKGNKPVTHIYPDVIQSTADDSTGHGAQKPISLFHNLLQRSVRPGNKVLDSFAGSGTIFPAAHLHQCQATGLELNSESYGMCLRRLQNLGG